MKALLLVAVLSAAACGGDDLPSSPDARQPGPAGTVGLVDAHVSITRNYDCGTECVDLTVWFALQNNTEFALSSLNTLRISVGELDVRLSLGLGLQLCVSAPWTPAPGEITNAIMLKFVQENSTTGESSLTYPCGASSTTWTDVLSSWGQDRPEVGTSVRLSADGTGWSASVVTPLRI